MTLAEIRNTFIKHTLGTTEEMNANIARLTVEINFTKRVQPHEKQYIKNLQTVRAECQNTAKLMYMGQR